MNLTKNRPKFLMRFNQYLMQNCKVSEDVSDEYLLTVTKQRAPRYYRCWVILGKKLGDWSEVNRENPLNWWCFSLSSVRSIKRYIHYNISNSYQQPWTKKQNSLQCGNRYIAFELWNSVNVFTNRLKIFLCHKYRYKIIQVLGKGKRAKRRITFKSFGHIPRSLSLQL